MFINRREDSVWVIRTGKGAGKGRGTGKGAGRKKGGKKGKC